MDVSFLEDGNVHIKGKDLSLHVKLNELSISDRLANIPRIMEKEDQFTLEISDNDKVDEYLQKHTKKSNIVHLLESKMKYSVIFLFTIVFLLYGYFFHGTHFIASIIAPVVPKSYVKYIGEKSFEYIDENLLFNSRLSKNQKKLVQNSFNRINKQKEYKLFIRSSSKWIGANALALPNGYIIITDEMAELTNFNQDALTGIFAHEIAHIDKKHSLKNIVQTSLSSIVIFLFSGDITDGVATISSALLYSKYSREFEEEADNEAIKTLNKLHISTIPLANTFKKIAKEHNVSKDENSYFSSHPSLFKRAKKLRENSLETIQP
ncbi:M48 family metallopeptidase [Sulfurospirillum arcachonense]|uniref:M48 family metallopeptidase n=1 Tax=Sulfurospirillum arcachonense TaxID=57666 RepID=UPI0004B080AA|nr:M48 family metallopeptidase [Sulfurospirillum arcachonense]